MKKISDLSLSVFGNPKYQGKHVLITKDKVYAYTSSRDVSKKFDELVKNGVIPTITFVPKSSLLIV